MKKRYLTLLLSLLITSSFGQKIRFTDTTNRWEDVHVSIADNPPDVYHHHNYYGPDTIINSVHYRQLIGADVQHAVFIREDSVLNKVFVFSMFDTTAREEVLMDYNLQVGDTIWHRYDHDTMAHLVSSIDSTMVGSTWHRVWHLNTIVNVGLQSGIPYTVIEGIGCTEGPVFPVIPRSLIEDYWWIYCFSNNNVEPPVNPPVGDNNFNNTTSCHLSVNDILPRNGNAYIIPNPADEKSKIVFPDNVGSGDLYVFNSVGQIVLSTHIHNEQEQIIGKLPNEGLYFYKVLDNITGKVFTGKFIYR